MNDQNEPIRFTVTRDFSCEELATSYTAGLSYTAGPEDTRLRQLLPQWEAEGRIVLGGDAATVTGSDA